jgi:hypothetical protein
MEFSATPDNAKDEERYIISWKNTLEYTIDRAQSFKVRPIGFVSNLAPMLCYRGPHV